MKEEEFERYNSKERYNKGKMKEKANIAFGR